MVKRNIAIAAIVLLVLGCATGRTFRDTLFFAQELYVAQYDEYLLQSAQTDLPEDAKRIMRVKRGILIELEPKIILMKHYLDTGAIPPDDLEAEVIRLVKKLMGVI